MATYIQQIGRAGRDGEPARCVLVAKLADVCELESNHWVSEKAPEEKYAYLQGLEAIRKYMHSHTCRQAMVVG